MSPVMSEPIIVKAPAAVVYPAVDLDKFTLEIPIAESFFLKEFFLIDVY